MKQVSKGVWSVMLTSFNDDNSLDINGIEQLIDFYINNGCSGLFAACSSSEVLYLSQKEIVELCRKTVRYADGRAEVVGSAVSYRSLPEQVDLVKRIADTGVSAPVVMTNQFCKQDDTPQVWADNFRRFLDKTEGPLGIYESPFPFKRLLDPDEMKLVGDSGRVVFHKDTCCDAARIRRKIKAVENSGLCFYNANVDTLVDSLLNGAHGYCGTATNFYPDVMRYVCDNFDKADFAAAAVDFIIQGEEAFKETYPYAGKFFLRQRGVDIKLNCRMPARRPFVQDDIRLLSRLGTELDRVSDLCGLSVYRPAKPALRRKQTLQV